MHNMFTTAMLGLAASLAVTGAAQAANIDVGDAAPGVQAADIISVSVTWTSNNVYNLRDQIYVTNGATLTIQPGTVVASTPTGNARGSLAITRGCMIIAEGTADNPIIFTSTDDVATWDPLASHPTGRNPETGTWRVAANEWGNITIMGEAFISQNCPANPNFPNASAATCNVNNLAAMEGLVPPAANPGFAQYGGNADNGDSGSLKYVSLRYGGRIQALATELNGLSLGGVGRATEIEHIEIMNNVDDGIEIWGGTVNLKWFSIWNIGDDSIDLDQGWRGKAQFGLVVQGYSLNAAQGSGTGDNCLELDGAETADAQPVTTATLYNLTVIGQPVSGDDGTAWRDNARVQIRNSTFMNLGEQLIQEECADNCSANQGYGFGGTLTFPQTWANAYTYSHTSGPNLCTNPTLRYTAQSAGSTAIGQGFLSELTDSVFYQNSATAYGPGSGAVGNCFSNNGSDALGVTVGGGSAPLKGNVVSGNSPIQAITRGPAVNPVAGLTILPVTSLDPRPANAALTSVASAPNDGFFTVAPYRGAFRCNLNWMTGWTAADAFGFSQPACAGDTNCDDTINVNDLLAVITTWGPCPGCPGLTCAGDVAPIGGDCSIDVNDLLQVITTWGACP